MPPLPSQSDEQASEPGRPTPGARLAVCLAAIAAIWLVVLPSLAQVPAIRTTIQRHEAHGVDPSAKFYSEVPAMPMIIRQVEGIKSSNEEAFRLPWP